MLTGFKSIRAKSDNTNRDWINAPCKCMPYWFLILWFDKRDPVYYANGQNTTTNLHFPNHIARIRVIIVRSGDENSFRNVHRVATLSIYFRTRVFSNKVPKMTGRWFHALHLVASLILKSVLRIYWLQTSHDFHAA